MPARTPSHRIRRRLDHAPGRRCRGGVRRGPGRLGGGDARPGPGPHRHGQPPGQHGAGRRVPARPARAAGLRGRRRPDAEPGKTHLIARLRSANPTGKPVLLSAHADTVGVEPELWRVDPFAGVIRGDYLYGRGSFDDKGGIAVFAAAAMRLAPRAGPADAGHRAGLRGGRGRRRLRDRVARRASLGQARRRLLAQRGRHHEHRRARSGGPGGRHGARQDLALGRAADPRRLDPLLAAGAAERDRPARTGAGARRAPPQRAAALAASPARTSARSRTPATAARPPICGGSPAPAAAARSSGSAAG